MSGTEKDPPPGTVPEKEHVSVVPETALMKISGIEHFCFASNSLGEYMFIIYIFFKLRPFKRHIEFDQSWFDPVLSNFYQLSEATLKMHH
jgi:hypothetical protein